MRRIFLPYHQKSELDVIRDSVLINDKDNEITVWVNARGSVDGLIAD